MEGGSLARAAREQPEQPAGRSGGTGPRCGGQWGYREQAPQRHPTPVGGSRPFADPKRSLLRGWTVGMDQSLVRGGGQKTFTFSFGISGKLGNKKRGRKFFCTCDLLATLPTVECCHWISGGEGKKTISYRGMALLDASFLRFTLFGGILFVVCRGLAR